MAYAVAFIFAIYWLSHDIEGAKVPTAQPALGARHVKTTEDSISGRGKVSSGQIPLGSHVSDENSTFEYQDELYTPILSDCTRTVCWDLGTGPPEEDDTDDDESSTPSKFNSVGVEQSRPGKTRLARRHQPGEEEVDVNHERTQSLGEPSKDTPRMAEVHQSPGSVQTPEGPPWWPIQEPAKKFATRWFSRQLFDQGQGEYAYYRAIPVKDDVRDVPSALDFAPTLFKFLQGDETKPRQFPLLPVDAITLTVAPHLRRYIHYLISPRTLYYAYKNIRETLAIDWSLRAINDDTLRKPDAWFVMNTRASDRKQLRDRLNDANKNAYEGDSRIAGLRDHLMEFASKMCYEVSSQNDYRLKSSEMEKTKRRAFKVADRFDWTLMTEREANQVMALAYDLKWKYDQFSAEMLKVLEAMDDDGDSENDDNSGQARVGHINTSAEDTDHSQGDDQDDADGVGGFDIDEIMRDRDQGYAMIREPFICRLNDIVVRALFLAIRYKQPFRTPDSPVDYAVYRKRRERPSSSEAPPALVHHNRFVRPVQRPQRPADDYAHERATSLPPGHQQQQQNEERNGDEGLPAEQFLAFDENALRSDAASAIKPHEQSGDGVDDDRRPSEQITEFSDIFTDARQGQTVHGSQAREQREAEEERIAVNAREEAEAEANDPGKEGNEGHTGTGEGV
ncbi:MAG: hypothetical protein M1831_007483 [Alyxoria varia]|nr:MAG: hypothetical protein M1831_007483 [Alyxoria varia]